MDDMGIVVSIHRTQGAIQSQKKPAGRLASFTAGRSIRNGSNTLYAAEPIYLEPNSSYALVVECVSDCGGDNYLGLGRSHDLTVSDDSAAGWSINNRVMVLSGQDTTNPGHWINGITAISPPFVMSITGYLADVFVSNESRAGDANSEVLDDGSKGFGQRFRTGNHGAGYLLEGVALHAKDSFDSYHIERSASIYTVKEDGSRKDLFVALDRLSQQRVDPPEWVRFGAPSNTRLLPSERYMLVVKCDSGCGGNNHITFTTTSSDGQSSLIDDGWTISDHIAPREDGWVPDTSVDRAVWMRVWGRFDDRPYLVDGGVAITSTPRHTGAGDTYVRGDEIEFTLTFNEAVDVSGTPGFTFIAGVDELTAAYASGSGTEELTFVYTVVAGDLDINGLEFAGSDEAWDNPEDAVVRAGDTVTALIHFDGVGNQAGHEIRGSVVRPAITDIEITSLPLVDDTYGLGETIEVTVTVDRNVDVTTSAHGPALAVELGPLGFRDAGYLRQDGNRKLVFGYVVVTGDSAPNGALIPADALADTSGELRLGGAIRSQLDADLDLDSAGLTRDPDHKVDATVNNLVDTRLAELTIDPGVLVPAFDPDVTQYGVTLANSVSRVTVSARGRIGTTITWFLPVDADAMANGHQVDIPVGEFSIRAHVQSADRARLGITNIQVLRNGRILPPGDAAADEDDASVGVTFELAAPSVSPVTFDWATADGTATAGADYAAASGTVTIAAGQTTAEVTVSILDDSDDESDETFEVTVSNLIGAEAADPTAEVVIRDDDEVGGSFSTTELTVEEGGSASYELLLTARPTGTVIVQLSLNGSTDVTFSPPDLTFTTLNWDTAQTVTVAAEEDDDAVADTAEIVHPLTGSGYALILGTVSVTVEENDEVGVSGIPATLNVREGSSETYAVVLDSEPSGDVTVTPARAAGGSTDVTFSPPSLTFTALNWATAQAVTVETVADADAVDESAVIEHTVTGANYAAAAADSVTVTVVDMDTAGVTVTEQSLDIPEGESRTYQVVLESEPTGPVTVMPMHTGSEDVEIEPTSLTFTPGNWETAQTVTVEAAADDDAAADTATINHVVGGADYGSVTAAPVSVTVAESDSVGVTVSATALTVPEGETGSYRVTLDSEPTGTVTITPTKTGSDHVVPGSTTLAFTDMNWETGLAVAVDAVADDDAVDDTATIDHAVSGADYGSATAASVSVTVDDDEEAGVTLSTRALSVPEGGSNTYTVVLDSEPTANVTVTPARAAGGSTDVTFAPSTLTFTPGNWETAQTVTVEAADDTDVAVDTATLTHAVSGGDYGTVTAGAVEVTVTEAQASGVTVMPTQLTVPEGFARTYEVSLDAAPAGTLTVTPSLGGEDDVTTATSTLTFTPTDWDAQTVTVTAPHDADAFDETVTIANVVTLPGGGTALASDVVVTVEDDDASDLIVTDVGEFVRTPGMSLGKLELCWRPEGVAVGDIEDFQYREKTRDPLVIPGLNGPIEPYNTDHTGFDEWQAAPANAAADCAGGLGFRLHERHVNVIKTYQVRGWREGAWLESGAALGVTVDAVQEFKAQVVGAASWPEVMSEVPEPVCADYDDDLTTVDEAGSFIVAVFFQTAPWSSVQKPEPVTGFDVAEDLQLVNATAQVLPGGYYPLMGYRVLVTPTTFGEPVQVGVPAAVATSLLTSSVNTASGTFERSTGTLADCEPGVTVSTTALTVTEEDTTGDSYTVVLDALPTADVTVTVAGHAGTGVTPSPIALTFTTTSWDRARTVTVTAGHDADAADDTVTLTHSAASTDSDYSGIVIDDVTVTVHDNDTPLVRFGASSYTATEGGADARVRVELSEAVGSPVTVPLIPVNRGGATNADYSGMPSNVTFGASETSKTFTVTAMDDSVDDDGESVRVGFGTLPAAVTAGSPATATVALADDDGPEPLAVSFGKTFYKAREGGEPATVKVQLNRTPASSVTIPLRTEHRNWATAADYSGVPPSVTFGPSERVRTFTVTVQRDNDIEDAEEVRIGFGTLPPGVVAGSPAWTSVALEDDLSVAFGARSYTAAEGGAGVTVTVRLTRSWGAPFTLPLTVQRHGGASTRDYTGIPGSVVFRTSDLEKTFTVTAVDDAVNDDGESVEIGFGWPRPQALWTGAPSTATVQLVDNDNAQPQGALRLAQGAGVYGGSYGRLQVYHDGRWGLVCDTNFDELGARVACRQLGFADGEEGYGGAGSGGLPFWLKGVECGGTESRLVNCPHWGLKKHSCGSFHIVGLECSRTPLSVTDARVAGALLTLSYDAALDGGSVPSGRDFVVTAGAPDGASAVPVTAVAVDGEAVSLTLARGVLPDERVRLSYLVAPMHPVQDISGGPAAPLTDVAVRNETEPGARTLEVTRSLDAVVAGALQPLLVIQHDGAAPGGTLSLPAEALVAGRAQPAPLDLSPWLAGLTGRRGRLGAVRAAGPVR